MQIKIQNGSVEKFGNTILEQINMEINDGEHIAIVGRNGAGKTTLLNAIIDNELLIEGIGEEEFKITKIGKFKIGYLEQIKLNDNYTLLEELLSSFEELVTLEKKIATLGNDLTSDKNIIEYSNLMERYEHLGGYTYRGNIEKMIKEFRFDSNDKDKLLKEFSGGERMKISFMKLLLEEPELLILDEPTNHLDITTIEWLETFLKEYKKAFLIVSHDRMFLDNTVDIIYDIEYGETIRYCGNYSKYIELKEEKYNKELKDYEWQQKEIKRLNDLFLRFRYKPTKAKMALSKLKQIERMTLLDKPNKADTKSFTANMKDIPKPGKIVLSLKDLEFGYDKVLGYLNLEVERGKKIGILGFNGIGKSTLLKTISNLIPPLKGEVSFGYNVKSAYFDQNLEFKTNGTVLEEFEHEYPNLLNEEARSALGAFLFSGEEVDKKLEVLSGGEKVRLLLCEIFYSKPNLIFLDEPTNHLDIISKEKLEHTLKKYPETILFVSHDRYFIKQVADEVLVFENGEIKHFKYGYEEYIEYKNKNKNEESKLKKKENPKTKTVVEKPKNTLAKVEKQLTKLYEELDSLNKEMLKEEVYLDYKKAKEVQDQIDLLNDKIKEKELEWESFL